MKKLKIKLKIAHILKKFYLKSKKFDFFTRLKKLDDFLSQRDFFHFWSKIFYSAFSFFFKAASLSFSLWICFRFRTAYSLKIGAKYSFASREDALASSLILPDFYTISSSKFGSFKILLAASPFASAGASFSSI